MNNIFFKRILLSAFLFVSLCIFFLRRVAVLSANGAFTAERISSASVVDPLNSATGTIFRNQKVRTFAGKRLPALKYLLSEQPKIKLSSNLCHKWGVVTTIFDPTDAVSRVASLPSWCLVIVPDLKTPNNYMTKLEALSCRNDTNYQANMDKVFYLSVEMQQDWENIGGPFASLVKSIPWNHFSRKNLGYLFAILHGADFIFDFDDDNFVKLGGNGRPMNILPDDEDKTKMKLMNVSVVMQGGNVFNHHPMMGASVDDSWPRGYPLNLIQDKYTQGRIAFQEDIDFATVTNHMEIGVIQYLADSNPDVDAIHRITRPLPVHFKGDSPVLVPVHAYTPYNAQATIHTKNAFWGLLLPATVPGRVSDIWRSYFAQCIFAETGLRLLFAPPKIEQIRNEHNYLGDFNAEQDLYNKAGQLIHYLSEWDSKSNDIPGWMEDLWIDLYEHGYIELNDVYAVQLWLGALVQAGYVFPPLKRRHRNVAVMGQFNYADKDSTVDDVIFWTQKNLEHFKTVVPVGPFSNDQVQALKDNSIIVKSNEYDFHLEGKKAQRPGYYSPLGNLRDLLLLFQNSATIDGVLYAHDDAILNVTELAQGQHPFPTTHILHTLDYIPSIRRGKGDCKVGGPQAYRAFYDGHVESIDKNASFGSYSQMFHELKCSWTHSLQPFCSGGQMELTKDPGSWKFQEEDGSILFPGWGQSDFMFVPTEYAELFAEAAELHLKHSIWIECAFIKVMDILSQIANAPTRRVNLCTNVINTRGSLESVLSCRGQYEYGVIHPFKIARQGYKEWSTVNDQMQWSPSAD